MLCQFEPYKQGGSTRPVPSTDTTPQQPQPATSSKDKVLYDEQPLDDITKDVRVEEIARVTFDPQGNSYIKSGDGKGVRKVRKKAGTTRVPYVYPEVWQSMTGKRQEMEKKEFNASLKLFKSIYPDDPRAQLEFLATPAMATTGYPDVDHNLLLLNVII